LATHGPNDEAEKIVGEVERRALLENSVSLPQGIKKTKLRIRRQTPFVGDLAGRFRLSIGARFVSFGLVLMVVQAFFFNAVFFTFSQVLQVYQHVEPSHLGYYVVPLAFGNAFGPLTLGPLFDHIGRKPMITLTYGAPGVLLIIAGFLFHSGWFTATTQTVAWTILFFIASCAARAAYLTASEIFPLEMPGVADRLLLFGRNLAGGVTGPIVFGSLIEISQQAARSRLDAVSGLFACRRAYDFLGAIAELFLGVASERKSLEEISTPNFGRRSITYRSRGWLQRSISRSFGVREH
jgi:MFS family permease